eukprot:m.14529 g.14529  ORF g.14529 m.14529 type:complete len:50 (-) comp10467_c0_seq1:698-847(-)
MPRSAPTGDGTQRVMASCAIADAPKCCGSKLRQGLIENPGRSDVEDAHT